MKFPFFDARTLLWLCPALLAASDVPLTQLSAGAARSDCNDETCKAPAVEASIDDTLPEDRDEGLRQALAIAEATGVAPEVLQQARDGLAKREMSLRQERLKREGIGAASAQAEAVPQKAAEPPSTSVAIDSAGKDDIPPLQPARVAEESYQDVATAKQQNLETAGAASAAADVAIMESTMFASSSRAEGSDETCSAGGSGAACDVPKVAKNYGREAERPPTAKLPPQAAQHEAAEHEEAESGSDELFDEEAAAKLAAEREELRLKAQLEEAQRLKAERKKKSNAAARAHAKEQQDKAKAEAAEPKTCMDKVNLARERLEQEPAAKSSTGESTVAVLEEDARRLADVRANLKQHYMDAQVDVGINVDEDRPLVRADGLKSRGFTLSNEGKAHLKLFWDSASGNAGLGLVFLGHAKPGHKFGASAAAGQVFVVKLYNNEEVVRYNLTAEPLLQKLRVIVPKPEKPPPPLPLVDPKIKWAAILAERAAKKAPIRPR
eukprot:TRINITY_DN7628_c0_g1_i1.p1 TRINITY_DN7628_c0_g1~~TRINITY_DN7628_c0_g1_i1.p1  ORF type:complete len:494 (+),score=146.84 TRINITY_DN7628_c0_g1_i1:27-1508(+)